MLPNSSSRPAGHHPPQSIPCLSAASRAARSTPVWPPETILSAFTLAAALTRRAILIAGRNNVGALDHQDDRTLRRACSVAHTFGNEEAVPPRKLGYAIFKIG